MSQEVLIAGIVGLACFGGFALLLFWASVYAPGGSFESTN